jgi:hypothetical protein
MIDQRIRRDVVVTGEFRECQAFTGFRDRRTGSRPLGRHCESYRKRVEQKWERNADMKRRVGLRGMRS